MRFETLSLHAGFDETEGPSFTPLVLNASPMLWTWENAEEVYELIDPTCPPHAASTYTTAALEERYAALEGGVAAIAVASGRAALNVAFLSIVMKGQNIVYCGYVNSETKRWMNGLNKYGISCRSADFSELSNTIDQNTRAVFVETPFGYRTWDFTLEKLSEFCKQQTLPLIVDNTAGGCGYLYKPIEHGADVVITTNAFSITGNVTVDAGIIVDAGSFNWSSSKFEEVMNPQTGLLRINYSKSFGNYGGLNMAYSVQCRQETLYDTGLQLDSFRSFIMVHGITTIGLRLQRQCRNAKMLQTWLTSQRKIGWVRSSVSAVENFEGISPGGFIIAFAFHGGESFIEPFLGKLSLCVRCKEMHVFGDMKTRLTRTSDLAVWHEDYIEVSVGAESHLDIQDDFDAGISVSSSPERPVTPVEDPYVLYQDDEDGDDDGAGVIPSGLRTPAEYDEQVMKKLQDDLKACENDIERMKVEKQNLENEMVALEDALDSKSRLCVLV